MRVNNLFNKVLEANMWDDFVNFAAYMYYRRRYSVFNSALIMIQKPGVEEVATENEWKRNGRLVLPDATPIVILQPFGPVNFVYEYCDTSGEEDAFESYKAFEIKENPMHENLFYRLKNMLQRTAIYYGERELGKRERGFAKITEDEYEFIYHRKNKEPETVYSKTAIVINSKYDKVDKAKTIIHEVAHIFCGHVGIDKKNTRLKVVNRNQEELSREQCEFEAEKVCELIYKFLGIKYDNREYLKGYLIDGKRPEINMQAVLQAFDKIIKEL